MGISSASSYALSRIHPSMRGTVHSVFNTSFNLEFDGNLLHVGSVGGPLSCIGLSVDAEEMSSMLGSVRAGDRALLHNGVVRIYSLAGVSELAVADVPRRDCSVRPLSKVMRPGMDIEVSGLLRSLDLLEQTGLPWTERSISAVSALARFSALCFAADEQGDDQVDVDRFQAAERAVHGAVEYLMGRGLGLTPSGDDILMGFGTALRYLHGTLAPKTTDAFFRAVAEELPGRTTAVSESYLQAMCAGQANEDYLDVLALLDSGNYGELPSAFDRVLSMGHTSGADSLLGFAAAFGCLL